MNQRLMLILGAALLALGTLGSVVPSGAALPAAVDGQPLPSLAPMLERATPAVVNIATLSRVPTRRNPLLDDPFFRRFFAIPDQPRERTVQSQGSGVVVDAGRGYIVTNHHVVEGADAIQVTLRDGRKFDAKVIGSDPETDIAVIKIEARNLTALPLADSDQLRVGDFVVAIGNPFGLGQTVTSGIVSALGRSGLGIQGYEDFIQTDASINPGNSGGALVNLRGELVGINTAIIAPGGGNVGIGFAVPSNMVQKLMEQLVRYGEIQRGQLGITTQDLNAELAQAFGIPANGGAVVTEVLPGSAAERAGLKPGDVITAVNGKPIQSAGALRNAIGLLRVGDNVTLDLLRNGRLQQVTARIREFTAAQAKGASIDARLTGATFKDIVPGDPLHGRVEGVLVADVARGSPAARAGLRPGDVITGVNRQAVTNTEELQRLAAAGGDLLLNVQRGRSALFLLLR
ncbi:MAG TPA: DegQ family serine endoprotease [Candidatus Competibacteraceae bacterium]|nr:DegQ family serine endoprotease [Candidatus Competibacteraceae bacterium]